MRLNGFAWNGNLVLVLLAAACGGEEESDISDGPDVVPKISVENFCERLAGLVHSDDLQLDNRGSETLEIESVRIVGDDRCSFRTPTLDTMTIEPSLNAFVHIEYFPQTAGVDQVAIEIISNDAKEPTTSIPMCGQAIGAVEDQTGDCGFCEGPVSDTEACAPSED